MTFGTNDTQSAVRTTYIHVPKTYSITTFSCNPSPHQNLTVEQTLELRSINRSSVANTFIMCGVLYGLKSSRDKRTVIDVAYDLLNDRPIEGVY